MKEPDALAKLVKQPNPAQKGSGDVVRFNIFTHKNDEQRTTLSDCLPCYPAKLRDRSKLGVKVNILQSLTSAQIGKAGELLVQLRLLQFGIDSSAMTTDAGIDVVAYSPRSARAVTIQVKTNQRPKQAGGRGRLALDWWVPRSTPADYVALTDLSELRIWLFTREEMVACAQQESSGRCHLYMYAEVTVMRRNRSRLSLVTAG